MIEMGRIPQKEVGNDPEARRPACISLNLTFGGKEGYRESMHLGLKRN